MFMLSAHMYGTHWRTGDMCQSFSSPQEFKGYVFKIMGGCDKQGFPMKQGVIVQGRVQILMHRGTNRSDPTSTNCCLLCLLPVDVSGEEIGRCCRV